VSEDNFEMASNNSMNIETFNHLSIAEKKSALFKCCGSTKWSSQLAEINFSSLNELKSESDAIWNSLSESDWHEAFSHHPKIGDVESLKKKFASTAQWATSEQSGVQDADIKMLEELRDYNNLYEKKFGYIFIVCATGKSAEEMLDLLKKRLINNPDFEGRIAAEEQNKITHLRLDKLFA
jgi:2-oxo-4-hydroxy-4-carboxy-5-ureidoimidazoline decarboxylase